MKITIDYNRQTNTPELKISYDAGASTLSEKLFEEFVEQLESNGLQIPLTVTENNGIKTVTFKINTPL